jgi:uncharacterized LabA/DUF88 family protein
MNRVILYIDGFNLYHALRDLGDKSLYWLDLPALGRNLLTGDMRLVHTHYFTARIKPAGRSTQDDVKRQCTYLDALAAQPDLSIHYGKFMAKPASCNKCRASWTVYEEKQSDVNLGVELTIDAFRDRFDTALVISADSDLCTPIQRVKQEHPEKGVIVAFPPHRNSGDLKNSAPWYTIGENRLRQSQLPETVVGKTDYPLTRPLTWR